MIQHSQPWLGEAEERAVVAVLRSKMLIGGEVPSRFRAMLAPKGGDSALFSSGRRAIEAALQAFQLSAGSGVVVQTYVCDAVIWAIRKAGLRPVLCDIGQHWTATPDTVNSVIDESCGAILLAPPFGFLQSAAPFRRFGLPILHDLCQASPVTASHTEPAVVGDLLTLSFHPMKYLCAAGGGAVLDPTGRFQERLTILEREHAGSAPFSDIQAALGCVQMERVTAMAECRAILFAELVKHVPHAAHCRLYAAMDVSSGQLFRLPLDTGARDVANLFSAFAEANVSVRHGVDQLAHRNEKIADDEFPNAVERLRSTLSVPFYPGLNEKDAFRGIAAIEQIL
jgi:perosamine synthetase